MNFSGTVITGAGTYLAKYDPNGLVVLCHSLGCVLWLHHARRQAAFRAERVLLVAPPVVIQSDPTRLGRVAAEMVLEDRI